MWSSTRVVLGCAVVVLLRWSCVVLLVDFLPRDDRPACPIFGGAQYGVSEPITYHAATTTLLFDRSSIYISVSHSGDLLLWGKQPCGRVSISPTRTHHPILPTSLQIHPQGRTRWLGSRTTPALKAQQQLITKQGLGLDTKSLLNLLRTTPISAARGWATCTEVAETQAFTWHVEALGPRVKQRTYA
jgi:hypothetical protein